MKKLHVSINCHQADDKLLSSFLSPLYWKKGRARVAKREQEPAVTHDALRLISLKNTFDTKTVWENMYSVIDKAAVIEKISVYFFTVVVIIIIIFIFITFFFTELLSQKILRNKMGLLDSDLRFSLLVWGLANTFAM